MNSKFMVDSGLRNIDHFFLASMSSKIMERKLRRPLIPPTFAELRPNDTAPFQYFKSENEESMSNEISVSGWTIYLDQSIDSWSDRNAANRFDIDQPRKKNSQYSEAADRYPNYDYEASSVTGGEKDCSMASDASTGPPKPPSPLQDIDFEEGWPARSDFSVARGKRSVHDKRDDLECTKNKFRKVKKFDDIHEELESTASCSSVDMKLRRNKFRKQKKDQDELELSLLLEDTANTPLHIPEVCSRIDTYSI